MNPIFSALETQFNCNYGLDH